MGGGVVSLIHHLVLGNLLMLPVLRLPAKRALPALVPLIATDGLAAQDVVDAINQRQQEALEGLGLEDP